MSSRQDRTTPTSRSWAALALLGIAAAVAPAVLPGARAADDDSGHELILRRTTKGAVAYIDGVKWGRLPISRPKPKRSGSVKLVVLLEDHAVLRKRVSLKSSSDTEVDVPFLEPEPWPLLQDGEDFRVAWESDEFGWYDGAKAPPGKGRALLGRRACVTQYGPKRTITSGDVVTGEPGEWEPRPAVLDLWDAAHGSTVYVDGKLAKDGAAVAPGPHRIGTRAGRSRSEADIEVLQGQRVVRPPPVFTDPAPIDAAHAWLAKHQVSDGRWSSMKTGCSCTPRCASGQPGYDVGVTGLALLALLDAGNTPVTGPHADAVKKGLDFLLESQSEEGFFQPYHQRGAAFGQAIAELAALEAWGATGDARLGTAAERGLVAIDQAQNPYLAWRYGMRDGDNDTAVTGWMALTVTTAAKMDAGLAPFADVGRNEVRNSSLRGAAAWLEKMTDPENGNIGYQRRGGGWSYRPEETGRFSYLVKLTPRDWSLTNMGLLAKRRIALVRGDDPDGDPIAEASLRGIAENAPFAGARPEEYSDVHAAWFGARVLRSAQKSWPVRWRMGLEALAETQLEDGSFPPDGAFSAHGGSVYTTALATLALQQWLRK